MNNEQQIEPEHFWERHPGETSKAYAAFCIYRDMGVERSYRKVLQVMDRTIGTIQEWTTKWQWVDRAAAYDDHLDRIKRKKAEQAIEKMIERQANQATALAQVMTLPVSKLIDRLNNDEQFAKKFAKQVQDLPAKDVIKMISRCGPTWASAVKVERLARGEPTDHSRVQQSTKGIVQIDTGEKVQNMMMDDEVRDAMRVVALAASGLKNDSTIHEDDNGTKEE